MFCWFCLGALERYFDAMEGKSMNTGLILMILFAVGTLGLGLLDKKK
jgi:hypothetical protein